MLLTHTHTTRTTTHLLPRYINPAGVAVGVFISKVTPGQLADRSGVVAVGQRLLGVNGTVLHDLGPKKTKAAAVALMRERRSAGHPLIITIAVEPSSKGDAPLSPGDFHLAVFSFSRFILRPLPPSPTAGACAAAAALSLFSS